ncbi:MAG: hypothetical protein HZC55_28885 [Verrucomicrobia bacterium]|nr:hypothetical protein [Verrucomicrobiota bacterium]
MKNHFAVMPRVGLRWSRVLLLLLVATVCSVNLSAQDRKKGNPSSKVYVTDVSGEATIDTGEAIQDLVRRSVFSAQGTVIETRKPETGSDRGKYFSTMVYSNGTGAFFDAGTRVEIRRFLQEPFTPNRNDLEVEPSISQTQAFVARGAIGLCTSKLVAGSNMTYATAHGSVNIRGRKVVIETNDDSTRISMLEGDATVRAGKLDSGGHVLRTGEQAIIRRDPQGQANQIEIRRIPPDEMPPLDDKVAIACMARKTVYFEVREKGDASSDTAAGAGDGGTSGFTPVTAFDGTTSGGSSREIVPVEILPTQLPVEYTVSNASLTTTPGR